MVSLRYLLLSPCIAIAAQKQLVTLQMNRAGYNLRLTVRARPDKVRYKFKKIQEVKKEIIERLHQKKDPIDLDLTAVGVEEKDKHLTVKYCRLTPRQASRHFVPLYVSLPFEFQVLLPPSSTPNNDDSLDYQTCLKELPKYWMNGLALNRIYQYSHKWSSTTPRTLQTTEKTLTESDMEKRVSSFTTTWIDKVLIFEFRAKTAEELKLLQESAAYSDQSSLPTPTDHTDPRKRYFSKRVLSLLALVAMSPLVARKARQRPRKGAPATARRHRPSE